ncbi:MAG: NUDIX hydrolase [Porticoccus sp.]|jgi:ADP-ribose pyrophosphatase YjhB (NUDIX family)|uniref:NUDIX hydrolase n=1 Tax=Porticoccus sp. TaxID=2024853 RepID=UPI0032985B4B|tara:strand:+ start:256 stop:816 length:561 start_codon:yes stop_codon:yes gene_type:complete
MNFCGQCGKPVNLKVPTGDNRRRHVCGHCDTIHYQNPRVISGCIPVVGDRVLLCRRAIEPRYGMWTLPAGFLENGETVLQGALRECWEEAMAKLNEPILSGIYDIPHINQVYILYRGVLHNGSYGAGDESLDVRLFSEADIPWEELAFPVITTALKHHFADLKQGLPTIHTDVITSRLRSLNNAAD